MKNVKSDVLKNILNFVKFFQNEIWGNICQRFSCPNFDMKSAGVFCVEYRLRILLQLLDIKV